MFVLLINYRKWPCSKGGVIPRMRARLLQACLTLCNSRDYSLPGCCVHGILQGMNTEVGCHALLQGIFLSQGSNPWRLLSHRRIVDH